MDFKESTFMYLLGCAVVTFIVLQSVFFLVKAWKQGKKLGIPASTLKSTVISSALFTIAPAFAILATVITLAGSLGLVLPWIRLSVIGNITYEATAAQAALDGFGVSGGLNFPVQDKAVFAAVAWVMSVGSVLPLILLPLFMRKIQNKIGSSVKKNAEWADLMSAAAFIGLIAAFISRSVSGAGKPEIIGDGAGVMSVSVLLSSMIFMVIISKICTKPKMTWLEPFAMPLSMFLALGVAVLLSQTLPANIVKFEWRG